MAKEKAPRNKTLDTAPEAGAAYLARCVTVDAPASLADVLDRTICGDALQVLPLLPRGCADLIVADPPYNLNKRFDSGAFSRTSLEQYAAYTARWLDAAAPLLREGGSIYVCCDWQSSAVIQQALAERFTVRSRITWQREKGRGAAKNWKNAMEDIWFATKGEDWTFHLDAVRLRRRVRAPYRAGGEPKDWMQTDGGKFRDTCPSNLWDDLTVPFWSMPENTAHPTQKPEKLAARILLASSDPGGVVLDPFLGSGTTSVAACKLGRHYIGIERSAQYCIWAEQRLARARTDPRIQGYEDGVFWERNAK